MIRRLAILGLLLVLGFGSPAPEAESNVVLDLIAQLDLAEVRQETPLIDIGTQAGRAFLGQGWSWNEKGKSGSTFVWSARHSSEINFFVADPRSLQIRIRCHPLRRETRWVEAIAVAVNGRSVGEVALRRGWKEYDFTLPADSIETGMNQIVFDYKWANTSQGPDKEPGKRQVAVAWDWIRFPEIAPSLEPTATDAGGLRLPAASQTDFYFEAPGETSLVIDEIKKVAGNDLEIFVRLDSDEEFDAVTDASQEGLRQRLTREAGLVQLRLLARGDVEIMRPRVLALTGPQDPHLEDSVNSMLSTPRVKPPLVLLYIIDTLRADHLEIYGYETDTGPGLQRLMTDGVMFEDAVSQSSWTKPSTASILTGLYPWSHGAEKSEDALPAEIGSLADHLQELGYATGAFSANGNIAGVFGFDSGFDQFKLMGSFDAPALEVQESALEWLANQDAARGVFLYLHTIDPHAPYFPTERLSARSRSGLPRAQVGSVPFMRQLAKGKQQPESSLVQELINLYDSEVSANDLQLAGLLETLKERGLYDRSLIMVMSDHGEEFYDHGSWTHGRTLHTEVLHVPLLIKFPGNWAAGARVTDTVQQIDLLPTVLDYLSLSPPPELPGKSLLCSIQQTLSPVDLSCATEQPRPIFASVHYHHNHWVGVTLGDWKLILKGTSQLDREAMLFDRASDPGELQNLAARYPVRVGYLTTLIRAEMKSSPTFGASQAVELDEETRQRLEALGYLN